MDAGILVVAATDGPMPQTKEHVLLCRQIGVETIIVFLNKCDLIKEDEMVDVVEMELKELLKKHEYDGDNTVFVRGSAISAIQDTNPEIGRNKIEELLKAMDTVIPVTGRPIDKPFVMSVEGCYNIPGRGIVASGTIEQGRAKIGDEIECYGYNSKIKSAITGIETFNKTLDYGEAGDNVGILIRGMTREQIHRGLILAKPGSLTTSSVIEANIYCLTPEEGGRKNSFTSGYRPQLFFKTADTSVEIELPESSKIAKPGDNVTIRGKLLFPLTISKGSRFALREGGKTIAAGVVTEILPETTVINDGKGGGRKKDAASTTAPGATTATPAAKTEAPKVDPKKPAGKTETKTEAPKAPAGKSTTPPPPAPAAKGKTPPPPPAKGKAPPPPPPKPAGKAPPPPPKPAGKVPPPPPPKKK